MFPTSRTFILWVEHTAKSNMGNCHLFLKGRKVEKIMGKKSPSEDLPYCMLDDVVRNDTRKMGIKPPLATRFKI